MKTGVSEVSTVIPSEGREQSTPDGYRASLFDLWLGKRFWRSRFTPTYLKKRMNLGLTSHQKNPVGILASLLILCVFTCLSCEEEESRTIPTRQPLPQEVLEDVLLKEIHKGRVVWVLNAARALNYEEEKVIKVYEIHLEFYDADQCVSSVLTADSGVVFASNKDMQATGNVKIVAPENAILHTDLLQWDNRERLISTEHEVRIETTESTITGVGFESDPELKHMKIREQFRARKTESQD